MLVRCNDPVTCNKKITEHKKVKNDLVCSECGNVIELPDDFILTESRAQAIDDGFQVSMDDIEKGHLSREAGWKVPVFLTSAVWDIIEAQVNEPKCCNDLDGVLWDVFYMSAHAGRQSAESFQVIITTLVNGRPNQRVYEFYQKMGPVDFNCPEPALTIMTEEDL